MPGLFDVAPGAWGSGLKENVIKCPGCQKLVYADKAKMDEHWASNHEKQVYTPATSGIGPRPNVIGETITDQIKGMLRDYPKGVIVWTGIVLLSTLVLSLLRFSR